VMKPNPLSLLNHFTVPFPRIVPVSKDCEWWCTSRAAGVSGGRSR
jgi:hypothetical protein